MAYGFRDNKSKYEIASVDNVYTKGDFVVIRGSTSIAGHGGTGYVRFSQEDLQALGITDVDKIAVLSVKQTDRDFGGWRYGCSYTVPNDTGSVYFTNNRPYVRVSGEKSLIVFLFGAGDISETTGTISFEVVILKLD